MVCCSSDRSSHAPRRLEVGIRIPCSVTFFRRVCAVCTQYTFAYDVSSTPRPRLLCLRLPSPTCVAAHAQTKASSTDARVSDERQRRASSAQPGHIAHIASRLHTHTHTYLQPCRSHGGFAQLLHTLTIASR